MKKLFFLMLCMAIPITAQNSKKFSHDIKKVIVRNKCGDNCVYNELIRLYEETYPARSRFLDSLCKFKINIYDKTCFVNALIMYHKPEWAYKLCTLWQNDIEIKALLGHGVPNILRESKAYIFENLTNAFCRPDRTCPVQHYYFEKLFWFICSQYQHNITVDENILKTVIPAFVGMKMSKESFEYFLIIFRNQLPATIQFDETDRKILGGFRTGPRVRIAKELIAKTLYKQHDKMYQICIGKKFTDTHFEHK